MSEQTGLLIKAVRKRPYLFDTSHEHYKNILKKSEAWDEIATELNLSSDMAKVKWKNLRDSYIRHKKSIQNVKGQDRKYVKWPWSTQMMFLDNHCLRGRPSVPPRTMTLREVRTTTAPPAPTAPPAAAAPAPAAPPAPPAPTAPTAPPAPAPPVPPAKETVSGLRSLKIPLPKAKFTTRSIPMQVIQNTSNPPRSHTYDAVDHLFLSYAETFKKFRPATQAVIKLQLATLFSRTELNELQEKEVNTSKIMISSPCEGRPFLMRNNGASTSKAVSP